MLCMWKLVNSGVFLQQIVLVLSCFTDDLDSLSSEENLARSPSPPPLQPFDECLPIPDQFSESAPILAYSPPNNSQSLGPPPLILMEDNSSSVVNWQQNHVFQENHNHSPRSPPTLKDIKSPNELPVSRTELTEIKRHNLNMRALAFKEVRRPGISEYYVGFVIYGYYK